MTITMFNTTKIVIIDNVPCRLWEGKTANGVNVNVFVAIISIAINEPLSKEFESDLMELKPPSLINEKHPSNIFFNK